MLNVEYKTMGQVNILLYYGGPRDEGKEEGVGLETKVATGQKMVGGKNSSWSGKSQGISLRVRENLNL